MQLLVRKLQISKVQWASMEIIDRVIRVGAYFRTTDKAFSHYDKIKEGQP